MPRYKITLRGFGGGRARDLYNPAPDEYEFADHFDDRTRPGRLAPYSAPTDVSSGQHGVGVLKHVSDGNLYALGTGDGNAYATIYRKTSALDAWETRANPANNGTVQREEMEEAFGSLFFWNASDGSAIGKHNIDSPTQAQMNGYWAGSGLVGVSGTPTIGPIRRYKARNALIFCYDNKFHYTTDGDSLDGSEYEFLLDPKSNIVDAEQWDEYMAFGRNIGNNCEVYFFDTNLDAWIFSRAIQGAFLRALKNVGGELVAICTPSSGSSLHQRAMFYVFRGGEFIQEGSWSFIEGETENIENLDFRKSSVRVKDNMLYFAAAFGKGNTTEEVGIYRFGFQNGRYTFKRDRFATTDNSENFASAGDLEWFGDYLFCVHSSFGTITRSGGATPASAAKYRSGHLTFGDFHRRKKLSEVSLSTTALPAGATATLKISADGGDFESVLTHNTTGATKTVKKGIREIDNFDSLRVQVDSLTGIPSGGVELLEITLIAEEVQNTYA